MGDTPSASGQKIEASTTVAPAGAYVGSTSTPPPRFIVGPAYMGDTGEGTETLTVDVLVVWPDEEERPCLT